MKGCAWHRTTPALPHVPHVCHKDHHGLGRKGPWQDPDMVQGHGEAGTVSGRCGVGTLTCPLPGVEQSGCRKSQRTRPPLGVLLPLPS